MEPYTFHLAHSTIPQRLTLIKLRELLHDKPTGQFTVDLHIPYTYLIKKLKHTNLFMKDNNPNKNHISQNIHHLIICTDNPQES